MAVEDIAAKFRANLRRWSEGNIRDFPWREENATPYVIFLAEIFLKLTRSQTVASVLDMPAARADIARAVDVDSLRLLPTNGAAIPADGVNDGAEAAGHL